VNTKNWMVFQQYSFTGKVHFLKSKFWPRTFENQRHPITLACKM